MDAATIENDLRNRWAPTPEQLAKAELLHAGANLYAVCFGIALPGKERGIWTFGQEVEHCLLPRPATGNDDTLRDAMFGASCDSARLLGERPGMAGHVMVRPDGTWSVWEEILSPLRCLQIEAEEAA